MFRFILSALFAPVAYILLGVSGITPMYFRWLGLTKHSTLPPIEHIPFLILPVIGGWLAWKGYRTKKNIWLLLLCMAVNASYAGILVYTIIDIWTGGRT